MKEIIRNNKAFLIPYLLFLIAGATLFLAFTKPELHLVLNQYHNAVLDQLFQYLTWLGEWPPFIIGPLLLFYRYRYALILIGGNLLAFGVTQGLKFTFFSNVVRPLEYFTQANRLSDLKLVEGVQNWLYNSFPSGHTTCAFATFFCLALISKSPLNKSLFFFFALAVAYSRVYLSQHFFDDIYAGSLVGFTCMCIMYLFIIRSKRPWMDKAIFSRKS